MKLNTRAPFLSPVLNQLSRKSVILWLQDLARMTQANLWRNRYFEDLLDNWRSLQSLQFLQRQSLQFLQWRSLQSLVVPFDSAKAFSIRIDSKMFRPAVLLPLGSTTWTLKSSRHHYPLDSLGFLSWSFLRDMFSPDSSFSAFLHFFFFFYCSSFFLLLFSFASSAFFASSIFFLCLLVHEPRTFQTYRFVFSTLIAQSQSKSKSQPMNNNLQVSSAEFVNYHYARQFQQYTTEKWKIWRDSTQLTFWWESSEVKGALIWIHAGATLGECWRGFVVENYLGW